MSDSEILVTVTQDTNKDLKFTNVKFGTDTLVLKGDFSTEFITFCGRADNDKERWKLCEDFFKSVPEYHVEEPTN